MVSNSVFDHATRNKTLIHQINDRKAEGTIEVLTAILEKLDELEARIAKVEVAKPETAPSAE